MKTINITEEQRNNLCSELARLLFEFKKNRSVKCIYFAPYKGWDTKEDPVLEVTLVTDGNDDNLEKIIQEYNAHHNQPETIDEYGLRIYLNVDLKEKYKLVALKPDEISDAIERENFLLNSVILYDEDGECTKIKERVTDYVHRHGYTPEAYYKLDNLSEIEPPIEGSLERAIDAARCERDTEAVREFTKSRIFQQFKGI